MPSPFVLATTLLETELIRTTIAPHAMTYDEGSIWDLVAPSSPTWITQANTSLNIDIAGWMANQPADTWTGIQATVQRDTTRIPQ
ncbi:MAG: hypothetical protein ACKPKO_00975, partial [Candidatus Fonsibacter sp.]